MPETKIILKYKREYDSWLCPECDTENSMTLGKCIICGFRKTQSVPVLKSWNNMDQEMTVSGNVKQKIQTHTKNTETITFEDDGYTPPEPEKKKSKIIWWIVAALFVIGLLSYIIEGDASAVYSGSIPESNSVKHETTIMMHDNTTCDYNDGHGMIDEQLYQGGMNYNISSDATTGLHIME